VNGLVGFGYVGGYLLLASMSSEAANRSIVEVPVTAVAPIVRIVTEKIPHESCANERVRVEHANVGHSPTAGIVGALIGGVVAGSLGHNSHYQPVIAGAGALLGASVGTDIGHRRNARRYYVMEQRCEVDYELRERENIIGYHVSYRYGDSIYHTQTREHPGQTIKLQVELNPLE
jgi:uncharacterized protein YcfJ